MITIDPETILREAKWHQGHGACPPDFLGMGMLYFALVYMSKAKLAMCLGSGGAFVPRCMRAAQRAFDPQGSRTILVDNASGRWGEPNWLPKDSYFRQQWGDVEIWLMDTAKAALRLKKERALIDVLHIDADHSAKGSWADFVDFSPLVRQPEGIITMHDPDLRGVEATLQKIRRGRQWDMVWFDVGVGLVILRPKFLP